jgi:hypothetical protein
MRRRTIFKLLVFLLAGAIINVAVAWGLCAASLEPRAGAWHKATLDNEAFWEGQRPDGFAQKIGAVREQSRFGVYAELLCGDMDGALNAKTIETGVEGVHAYEFAARVLVGWPLKASEGTKWILNPRYGNAIETSKNLLVWRAWPASSQGIQMPYKPIWPGFAINTIFYAAIVWFLFFAPAAIVVVCGASVANVQPAGTRWAAQTAVCVLSVGRPSNDGIFDRGSWSASGATYHNRNLHDGRARLNRRNRCGDSVRWIHFAVRCVGNHLHPDFLCDRLSGGHPQPLCSCAVHPAQGLAHRAAIDLLAKRWNCCLVCEQERIAGLSV